MNKRGHSDFVFEFENSEVPNIEIGQSDYQPAPDEPPENLEIRQEEYYDLVEESDTELENSELQNCK